MGKLIDHLVTEESYASIKDVKFKLGDDEFIAGIKDQKTVTYRDYKDLSLKYVDLEKIDVDDLKDKDGYINAAEAMDSMDFSGGDTARYLFFIKYVAEADGTERQNMTIKLLDSMPMEFFEQMEQHIPSMEEVMGSLMPGFKKKSEKLLERAIKNQQRSKTRN